MQGLHGVLIKYTGIYLWKQNSEYIWCSTRLLYKLLSSYRDRSIQNTVKRLRRSVLGKKKSNKKWNQEPGHFDKLFLKNTRKTRRAGKHFGVFSLTLKTIFLIHYSPVLLTYTPLKHPKTFRFLHVHQAFERSLRF